MAVNPMLTAGMNGIQEGLRGMHDSAQTVAASNLSTDVEQTSKSPPDQVAEALVEMQVYARQVQASAEVVRTADEVMGFLLSRF